jgi:phospholipase C
MSDNFHQSVDGGTGANHIMLGHGDAIWFSDGKGHAKKPPHDVSDRHHAKPAVLDEIENPNPAPRHQQLVCRGRLWRRLLRLPGIRRRLLQRLLGSHPARRATVVNYLQSLPHPIDPHCEVGHYYLLNNYNPGYFGNGNNAFTDTSPDNTVFTIPPSSTPSIGDSLLAAENFLEVLRRPMEQLRSGSVSAQLWSNRRQDR